MERTILHADMNNCYASIEVKLNPQWKGLPLAVCGSQEDRHGIVLAKSQEAKDLGVKTGEAIWQAKIKCPDLLIVPPHYEEYLKHSRLARKIYYDYTNQVEPFGLDECWLDVTGSTHLFGRGLDIANILRKRMKEELGITISVGVSFNKVFAKLGSDLKKPDAVTEIPKDLFREIVWNLPVEELIGIGRSTKRKLNHIGIYKLGQLANVNPKILKKLLGVNGCYLWNYANGLDDSPVVDRDIEPEIKTIGRGITCTSDLMNNSEVRNVFQELSLDVSKKLREYEFQASGIQITVRDNELSNRQYQAQLKGATQSSINLTEKAMELFISKYDWSKPIRSLTIRAINLITREKIQQIYFLENYEDYQKKEKLDTAIYNIRKKYGKDKLTFASLMGDIKMPKDRTEIVTLPNMLVK